MPIINPTQLVEEFKKSGEFDRLRKELLAQFRSGDSMISLMDRVDDIARQKMASDSKLQYMSETAVARELMQELDRYPIVERAVTEVHMLSDPSFASGIRESVKKILQEDKKGKANPDVTIAKGESASSPAKRHDSEPPTHETDMDIDDSPTTHPKTITEETQEVREAETPESELREAEKHDTSTNKTEPHGTETHEAESPKDEKGQTVCFVEKTPNEDQQTASQNSSMNIDDTGSIDGHVA